MAFRALSTRLFTAGALGVALLALAPSAPASAQDGPTPLISLKNALQGSSGSIVSPASVQERTFENGPGTGALLLDAENARQGITQSTLSPGHVDRDTFVNHG